MVEQGAPGSYIPVEGGWQLVTPSHCRNGHELGAGTHLTFRSCLCTPLGHHLAICPKCGDEQLFPPCTEAVS